MPVEPSGTNFHRVSFSGGLQESAPTWQVDYRGNATFTGNLYVAGTFTVVTEEVTGNFTIDGNLAVTGTSTFTGSVALNGGAVLGSAQSLAWSTDLFLYRDAANSLALRNASAAQSFILYSNYNSSANNEFMYLSKNGGGAGQIYTNKTGTGTVRDFEFGRIDNLLKVTSAALYFETDNTFTFGDATHRASALYTVMLASGSAAATIGFGGTASTFPALRRAGLSLEVCPADGSTAAVATNATSGFFSVTSCAGAPTGTPTPGTGNVPLVIDTTNSKIYAYIGAAWKGVTVT